MRNILFLFAALLFCSCHEKVLSPQERERIKIRAALDDYIYPSFHISEFPVLVKCAQTKDSMLIMAHGISLFHKSNITLFGKYSQFADALADIIASQGYLTVDSTLFRSYNSPNIIITKDEAIDSVYTNFGLEGLIHNYLDEYGAAKWEKLNSVSKWDYLRYLFYQNDILFFWNDLDTSFYSSFYFREDADKWKKYFKPAYIHKEW